MRKKREIKIGEYTLSEILKRHKQWANGNIKKGRRADLHGADLHNTDMHGADLRGADLRGADLYGAGLSGADLRDADLRSADLRIANLYNAKLNDADLHSAALQCADLYNADLHGANIYNTNLCKANLNGAKGTLIEYRKGKILTDKIIGYKKCKDDIIVTLEIPRGAIVFSINGNKCRTNKAKITAIDGADRAYSNYGYVSYYIGDEFTIYDFNCEYNIECGKGIHFFMTKEEAEQY